MVKRVLLKSGLVAAALGIMLTSGLTVEAAQMRSAKEIVHQMGIGWNLGNTLDSFVGDQDRWFDISDINSWETCWGNPVTTKAMVDKVKEAGFRTIRVPVTWGYHTGPAPSYTISQAWMQRVKEVVDYGIDNGMYVILNTHHESDWCIPTFAKQDEYSKRLSSEWTQIANTFKDYDDHLIFEVQNEPRHVGTQEEWMGGTWEGRQVVNSYNAAGLRAIRATGGNNSTRAVMLPTYGASGTEQAIRDFSAPDDKNIIVSLHAYSPYFFAADTSSSSVKNWGSQSDIDSLNSELKWYHDFFANKGLPVVMGEFGTINKNNLSSRLTHVKTYVETCTKLGMPCVWWDNNYSEAEKGESFGLLNRSSLSWTFPEIKDTMVDTYKANAPKDIDPIVSKGDHVEETVLYGDVDGNGVIDLSDYTLLRKFINAGGNSNINIKEKAADVNKDGVINFFDLVALKALV